MKNGIGKKFAFNPKKSKSTLKLLSSLIKIIMHFKPGHHTFNPIPIPKISDTLEGLVQNKLDHKTKPLGSLGDLETIARRISLIQDSQEPKIVSPTLFIFAADHGITHEGVSAYPQEVTYQMVLNFLNGGAAANVLARQVNMEIQIIDSGVNHDFGNLHGLIHFKIGPGTRNFLKEPALTELELLECLSRGKTLVLEAYTKGSNLLAFGEMGIGNTSASSMLTHVLTGIPLDHCIGSGTGMDSKGMIHKKNILVLALNRYEKDFQNPSLLDALRNFGGFEILMMAGAMLEAAEKRMILVVDGFISTGAWLCAYYLNPEIINYTFFSHKSGENGHRYQLEFLGVKPILDLNLRLGEGTGAVLAVPILQSAIKILNEMASFDSAGVSQKEGS